MSNSALAYTPRYGNVRRARLLRAEHVRQPKGAPRATKPWSEVSVAGALIQTSTVDPPHIRRWQWVALAAAVLVAHGSLVWFFDQLAPRDPVRQEAELNIEIVRPPKPPEPPKPEPPRPPPPKAPPKEAKVLPRIQQSEPLPSTEGESSEPAVAVAPVISEPAPPPPPPPEPVTEPMGHAGYLNNPAPDYPPQAVRQGWQGTVLLRVRVLANGRVESVEVKQTSGKKVLDDEAMRTVKRWSFEPAKRGATPIDGWATVPIEFVLDQ